VGFSIAAGLLALASIAVARYTARGAGLGGWRLDALTAAVFLLGIAPLLQTFRAQEVSALAFLVLLACIRAFDAGKRESVLGLPPLFLLWANVHGGWVLGGTILAMWAVTRFAASPRDPARLLLMGACLIAAAATLVNPDGTPRALGHPRVALRRDERADAGRVVRDHGRSCGGGLACAARRTSLPGVG